MHAMPRIYARVMATSSRLAALAFVSLIGSTMLAGCASGPEIDPIYKVVPPAQQYTCRTGNPNCTPPRLQRNPATRY